MKPPNRLPTDLPTDFQPFQPVPSNPPNHIGWAVGRKEGKLEGTPWWQIEVPRPPSVNKFMKNLGNCSPVVRSWQKGADAVLFTMRRYPRLKCPYELMLVFPAQEIGKYDLDNRTKATSDWLQSREVVQDDRHCRRIVLEWGEVPAKQCRIMVRPWVSAT